MTELELIARFVRHFERGTPGMLLGPGDDAALLRINPGLALVATTDAVIEGVHFGPGFSFEDIGHKALAVNLSDLAAMGAQPRWLLVALELPARTSSTLVDGIARGMAALARRHGCGLAGGNVVRSTHLALTLTVLGEVPPTLALRRDRLAPGDVLAVTGTLGGAALGLKHLRRGSRKATTAQRRPNPRIQAGLAARGLAHAAIDVSDGLARDLCTMADASRVRVDLSSAALPVARGATPAMALSGGEDYELVFGLPARQVSVLRRRLAKLGVPLCVIGSVREGRGLFLDQRRIAARGFDHFEQHSD